LTYKIIWHEEAIKDLKKLDKPLRNKIFERVTGYLAEDPSNIGKPLTGNFAGLHRYRYGDYRIIYTIDISEEKITILEAGHRKNIYDR